MNKQRSAKVAKALKAIATAREAMDEALEDVRTIRDDIGESLDNMSDGARQGGNGQNMEMDLSTLDELLDGIDGFDLKGMIEEAAQNLDLEAPEIAETKLSAEDLAARRESRLPQWARIRIENAEKERDRAIESAEKVFGEPKGEPEEFIIWRQHGPFKGRLIPTEIIEVPILGIKLRVQPIPGMDEKNWGLEVMAGRELMVKPIASNMAFLLGKDWG